MENPGDQSERETKTDIETVRQKQRQRQTESARERDTDRQRQRERQRLGMDIQKMQFFCTDLNVFNWKGHIGGLIALVKQDGFFMSTLK